MLSVLIPGEVVISGASIIIAAIIYVARLVSRLTERVAHIEGMLAVKFDRKDKDGNS